MRIYIAGFRGKDPYVEIDGFFKDTCILTSFYYNSSAEELKILHDGNPKSIIVDSGAHTFFTHTEGVLSAMGDRKYKKKKMPNHIEFLHKYARFISKAINYADYFVELDTQEIHGKHFQKYQRDLLKEVAGEKFLPVWHANEDIKDYYKLLDEYPFVCVEGIKLGRLSLDTYKKFTLDGYKAGVKIHVFASVNWQFMLQVPIYSTDSSTFFSSSKYGRFTISHELGRFVSYTTTHKEPIREALGHIRFIKNFRMNTKEIQKYKTMFRGVVENYNLSAAKLTEVWKARGIDWKD
jgi:hypothetical protein